MSIIPSIKVSFNLIGEDFDFDVVTTKIGVNPTRTKAKSDCRPQTIAAGFAHSSWSIDIKEENCIAVSHLFRKMLETLNGKSEIIKNICDEYNIEAGFVVVIHMKDGDRPEMVLPREVVSFAGAINAEIGFDIYWYDE